MEICFYKRFSVSKRRGMPLRPCVAMDFPDLARCFRSCHCRALAPPKTSPKCELSFMSKPCGTCRGSHWEWVSPLLCHKTHWFLIEMLYGTKLISFFSFSFLIQNPGSNACIYSCRVSSWGPKSQLRDGSQFSQYRSSQVSQGTSHPVNNLHLSLSKKHLKTSLHIHLLWGI